MNENLDQMQEFVAQYFSDVRLDSLQRSQTNLYGLIKTKELPFTSSEKGKFIWYEKKSSTRTIDFIFILDEIETKYKIKPLDYLTYLLKYSGEGSLFNYLKKMKYALKIDVGIIAAYRTFSEFAISVDVTSEGFNNIDKVISIVFEYLNLIKSSPIDFRIYNEIHSISKTQFK